MKHKIILGAIACDVIGSVYEFNPVWQKDFELITRYSGFTDDTVMTVANADWLVSGDSLMGIMQEYALPVLLYNKIINPAEVVANRTNVAAQYNETFLTDNDLEELW